MIDPPVDVPSRKQPLWLVALALGLAVVAAVLIVVLVTGREASPPAGGCDGAFAVLARDFGEGNGSATPMLAVEELVQQSGATASGSGRWHAAGLAADSDNPMVNQSSEGALVFVRLDGSTPTGQVVVTPAYGGSGWNATAFYSCP